jgi:NhaA family Na+:H+ antiporter
VVDDERASDRLFSRGSWPEAARIADVLRQETVGGALLLVAATVALLWANSPWGSSYTSVRELAFGPEVLHLHLTLAEWAADGLLAIFFFVAGLELKREFVAGDLRDPRRGAVPIAAAIGGVTLPALLYLAVNWAGAGEPQGWAIPTATDIAFALAVLAVIGSRLPSALRTFLLTLAVVDDLIAITIIALFYTDDLSVQPLVAAALPLGAFAVLVQRRVRAWWLLLPLAAGAWTLVHASGVHATVAGVLLGLTVPVRRRSGEGPGLAEHFEHRFRPISASVAVPIFALLASGVAVGSMGELRSTLTHPVALGILAGLVVGKPVGVMAATAVIARFTHARLDDDLSWWDVLALGALSGVGFTVSLLIGELAFGVGSEGEDMVKTAVLSGSLVSALIAGVLLRRRSNVYARLEEAELADAASQAKA